MNELELERYLARVRREMKRMDPAVTDEVIAELKDSIMERGEITETPKEVARGFLEVYGFGRSYIIRMHFLIAIISFISIPITSTRPLFALTAMICYFGTGLLLVWFGAYTGKKTGISAGILAMTIRFVGLLILVSAGYIISQGGLVFFTASTLVFPLLGWIPGGIREGREEKP